MNWQIKASNIISFVLSYLQLAPNLTYKQVDDLIKSRIFAIANHEGLKVISGPTAVGFPGFACISGLRCPCHGVPTHDKKILKEDLVKVDIAISINGLYADSCHTYLIGKEYKDIYVRSYKCFQSGIRSINNKITIYDHVKSFLLNAKSKGIRIMKEFTGHGVGEKMHMEPFLYYSHNCPKEIYPRDQAFTFEPIMIERRYRLQFVNEWEPIVDIPCIMFEHTIRYNLDLNRFQILTENVFDRVFQRILKNKKSSSSKTRSRKT